MERSKQDSNNQMPTGVAKKKKKKLLSKNTKA